MRTKAIISYLSISLIFMIISSGDIVAQDKEIFIYQGTGKKSFSEKIEENLDLANRGNSRARVELGKFYYYGIGIKKDIKKARYWLTKAANQDHALADGVELNYTKAFPQARLSAELGHTKAQYLLGFLI